MQKDITTERALQMASRMRQCKLSEFSFVIGNPRDDDTRETIGFYSNR
jgi:hypothetical protein